MIIPLRVCKAIAVVAVAMGITASAWSAQDAAQLIEDFSHYSLIAKPDLAAASAQTLLDSGITNAELAVLLDEGKVNAKRFDDAIARALRIPELEAIAADLAKRVEDGRLDLSREPQRIEEAVNMLVGAQRARLLANRRLQAAGEYAVPPLLRQISESRSEALKLAAQDMLVQIGRPAVSPLCAALPSISAPVQRVVCDVLGAIRNPAAAPYLRELSLAQNVDPQVKEAAARAYRSLGVSDAPVSNLYTDLARQYFDGHESLIAFANEPTNNVWVYLPHSGLSPAPVPTPIYPQVMAMRTSSRALQLDRTNNRALSLYVAANLKRENDLAQGAVDPVYGENPYSPDFYATVFGTQTCLDVLGLAIDKLDTRLVRDAIAALAKTTGGANLFAREAGRQPLLEALMYPDRRVQYEAALTLARALPQSKFAGDSSVVPILASAVRMGSKSLALVVVDNDENRGFQAAQLQQIGFDVIGSGANVLHVQQDIGVAVGVDLVVVRMARLDDAKRAVAALRAHPKTAAAPLLLLAGATELPSLQSEYRDDPRVHVMRAGVGENQFVANMDFLMQRAAGGRMTEAESEEYAILALAALRDVAISRSPAYSIIDAESALIDALGVRTGGTRMKVAEILALLDSERAQRSLFDAALAASDQEQIELLQRVSDSVRLFGDRAEHRHVQALLAIVTSSGGELADAAATVHGALNLPAGDAVKLIPQ